MCCGWKDEKASVVTNTGKIVQEIERLIPGTLHKSKEQNSCNDIFCKEASYVRRSVFYFNGNNSPLLRRRGDKYVAYDMIHAGWISIDMGGGDVLLRYATFLAITVDGYSSEKSKYYQDHLPEGYEIQLIDYSGYKRDEIRWLSEHMLAIERVVSRPVLQYLQLVYIDRNVYSEETEYYKYKKSEGVKLIYEYIVLLDSDNEVVDMVERWVNYEISTSQLLRYAYRKAYGEVRGSGRRVVFPGDDVINNVPLPNALRDVVSEVDKHNRDAALMFILAYTLPYISDASLRTDPSEYITITPRFNVHFVDNSVLEVHRYVFEREWTNVALMFNMILNVLATIMPFADINYETYDEHPNNTV